VLDAPNGSVKEERLLRDDGELLSQLSESESDNVDTVNFDLALGELDDAEEGLKEGGFAC
jgi:hypothetical protein